MHGYELDGFDSQILRNIATKEECQAACLRTLNSQCRSAEFVPRERVCRMSSENRRTQLRSFRATSPEIIYMENQCAGGNKEDYNLLSNNTVNLIKISIQIVFQDPPHCEYSDQTGRVSPWYDRAIALDSQLSPGTTLAECRRMCDAERDFHCKSVSVSETKRTPVCLLSADDSVSFSGVNVANVLIPDREYVYSERSSCSNSNLYC